MERWRAVAMCIGEVSNAISRADDAAHASGLGPEDKPLPLAANAEEPRKPTIDADVMKMIEDRIEDLTARMDALERRRAAEEALTALEDEIERMYPPKEGDDDMGLVN
jgi:hypothetical protein